MTLNQYQEKAMRTCLPESENLLYMLFNLQGEVGEFSSKVAKLIRKGKAWFNVGSEPTSTVGVVMTHNEEVFNVDVATVDALQKEAGDILWQLSGLCSVLGWKLEDVAQDNLDKLASRQQRNVIDGNGDNR